MKNEEQPTQERETIVDFHAFISEQISNFQKSLKQTEQYYSDHHGPVKKGDTVRLTQYPNTQAETWADIKVQFISCSYFPVWFYVEGEILDCDNRSVIGQSYRARIHVEGTNWEIVTPIANEAEEESDEQLQARTERNMNRTERNMNLISDFLGHLKRESDIDIPEEFVLSFFDA